MTQLPAGRIHDRLFDKPLVAVVVRRVDKYRSGNNQPDDQYGNNAEADTQGLIQDSSPLPCRECIHVLIRHAGAQRRHYLD